MSGKRNERRKGRKIVVAVVLLILILAAAAGICYGAFRMNYYGKSNYVSDHAEAKVFETLAPETSVDEEGNVEYITEHVLESEEEASVKQYISDSVNALKKDEGLSERQSGVYDLLLIGVDRRDDSWYGNSDVMILLTVNHNRKTVYLTSFLRDLAADIPGVGVRKLNAACAHGGAKLVVQTIEENFGVDIDNYAMVDFNAMIQVVDALGGVDLELTEDEVKVANGYIETMCSANKEPFENHRLTGSGMMHLDGYQAVGYSRNRYSGSTSDFGRTDRQRKVLMAIFDQTRDSGVDVLNKLVQAVLPYVTHNISETKLLSLVTQIPAILGYTMEQQYIPYDNMYHSQNEMLVPDMEETIRKLHETIYSDGQ